jgi:N-acetylmuramoyl-L-alanine amidase
MAGEWVEVRVRGTPGARVQLVLPDGSLVPLVESGAVAELQAADDFRAAPPAAGRPSTVLYSAVVPANAPWLSRDTAVARPRLLGLTERALALRDAPAHQVPPRPPGQTGAARELSPRVQQLRQEGVALDTLAPRIELIAGRDTVRRPLRVNLAVLHPAIPLVGVATPPANSPPDWTLRGRIDVAGPFHYFWPAGTRFRITGERSGMYRVQLAGDLSAWVPAGEVRLLAPGTPPPAAAIGAARFNATSDYVELRVPLGERLPFRVEETEYGVTLDVFGGISRVNYFQYGTLDPLLERAVWSQPADSVFRVHVELTQPVWGYDVTFDRADALLLRIRRPPVIDPEAPFRGVRIVLDPGHPPAGAIGPTGLTEAEANLANALRLRPLLEQAGAHVIMTRTDSSAVELGARPRMAVDSGAHILVSLHNNAFPDGVNPFQNNGTSVYYFQPHSVDLAQRFQAELLDELGLRDIGIGRADLALVRPSWFPAALTETMYLMVPQQEAALRDPVTQERIARAHFRALEAFLRARAAARR